MTTDHRAELLRTQAVQACLAAMGAAEAHVYGTAPHEWRGTILANADTMTTTTHWHDVDGTTWRYETTVTVAVTRQKLHGPAS